jgi:hypothetical protein
VIIPASFRLVVLGTQLAVALPPRPTAGPLDLIINVQSDDKVNTIDARLEAAAVTAALVRSLSLLVIFAEDMASNTANKPENRQYAKKRATEFHDAIDISVESYQRLIGEIAESTSEALLTKRLAVVEREMGQRGQGPVASVFPVMGEHIRAIQGGAPSSNAAILEELLAVSNR